MKIIITFLTVCGLAAAQPAQAPSPVQKSTGNAAGMADGPMPIYRVTVVARDIESNNLPQWLEADLILLILCQG